MNSISRERKKEVSSDKREREDQHARAEREEERKKRRGAGRWIVSQSIVDTLSSLRTEQSGNVGKM